VTDTFARDRMPPPEALPELLFDLPALHYPQRLNAARRLLDDRVGSGDGARRCIVAPGGIDWTYGDLLRTADAIAHVLTEDFGIVPGNRVLLRAANTPMLAACWFAVLKAGAIAVTTMPLYRAVELGTIVKKAEVSLALVDARLADELETARADCGRDLTIVRFNTAAPDGLEARMDAKPHAFQTADTRAEDVALIAFTSGTTGVPKATMHTHRDVMATCDSYCALVLRPQRDDLFCGSPPLGFTFGLGGLLLFPLWAGASTLLLEKAGPEDLMRATAEFGVTTIFTAPVAYRVMASLADRYDLSTLRTCVSAGETLPEPIWNAWYERTGLKIMDGIGSTELLHIFIGSGVDEVRPGSTGRVVPGYRAEIHDDGGNPLPPGEIGRLAVKGPTGCKYLDDDRQAIYVQRGWNYPGDAYRVDEDGYFWYVARTDDMIISSGYNVSGPEVENALLAHGAVKECAVVAKHDAERSTNIVKAFVVVVEEFDANDRLVEELMVFCKARIAPFKSPREIEFVDALPRTETGKVQRFRLREVP
jgi:2-aminobenzoate-CoA ligase